MNCIGASLLALLTCLGDPDPNVRDRIAFERLSSAMRAGDVDRDTLATLRERLLQMVGEADPQGFQRPFAILTLAEVARTDRMTPWMTDADRDRLVKTAADYLSSISDYRAYSDREGFRHGVAHGADFAMQLALNPAIAKPQLDRLLAALAVQVGPRDPEVAYWAGEPDRLARAVTVIAQRGLHSDAEWTAWLQKATDPKPLVSWDQAFKSEAGIRRHHNVRAFLLSLYASATASDDAGIKRLAAPVTQSLKALR